MSSFIMSTALIKRTITSGMARFDHLIPRAAVWRTSRASSPYLSTSIQSLNVRPYHISIPLPFRDKRQHPTIQQLHPLHAKIARSNPYRRPTPPPKMDTPAAQRNDGRPHPIPLLLRTQNVEVRDIQEDLCSVEEGVESGLGE